MTLTEELLKSLKEVYPYAERYILKLNADMVGTLYPAINQALLDRAADTIKRGEVEFPPEAPPFVKCHYCDNCATKTLIWLYDKNKRPARIRVMWCGCDLQVALKKFWPNPYTVREGVDYQVQEGTHGY